MRLALCSYRCVFFIFCLFFVSPCLVLSVASWGTVSLAVSSSLWERRFLYSHERYFSFSSICWASQHPGCVFPLLAGFLTETQYVRWCTTLTFPPTAESWWSQWSLWCTLLLKVSEHAVTVVQSAYHLLFCFDFSLFAVGFPLFVVCWYVVRLESVKP